MVFLILARSLSSGQANKPKGVSTARYMWNASYHDTQHAHCHLHEGLKKDFNIALMCAEADPLECHRFGMITPALKEAGIDIQHILKDSSLIDNETLEAKLG